MGGGRFWYMPEAGTLRDALASAMWSGKHPGMDERLDDGTTDIDTLDAFEYVRTAMSKAHIPNDNRRWLLVSPETYALILKSPEFVRATQLGDAVVQTGAQGRIAGFNVFEDTTLSETTDFIAGHS